MEIDEYWPCMDRRRMVFIGVPASHQAELKDPPATAGWFIGFRRSV